MLFRGEHLSLTHLTRFIQEFEQTSLSSKLNV
jgi:hypothetical protein